MKLLGSDAELLNRTSASDQPSILLPLSSAVRYRKAGTGTSIYAEETLSSYQGSGIAINVLPLAKSESITAELQISSLPLVDYARSINNSPELPWNAVPYNKEREKQAATYSASLDLAIEAASAGDFQVAISTLEAAATSAPSDLEKARVYALLGRISGAVIGGNVGGTQGLAFFNQAMRFWPRTAPKTHLTREQLDNPIDLWLFDTLTAAFLYQEKDYPRSARILGVTDPRIKTRIELQSGQLTAKWWFQEVPADAPASIIGADRKRLTGWLEQYKTNSKELAVRINEFIANRPSVARWVFETLLNEQGNNMMSRMTIDPELQNALVGVTELCPEPWKTRYRHHLGLIAIWGHLTTLAFKSPDQMDLESAKGFVKDIVQTMSQAGFPETAAGWSTYFTEGTPRPSPALPIPNVPWWDLKYLDYFGKLVVDTAPMVDVCKTPGQSCKDLLEGLAVRGKSFVNE